MGCKLQCDSRRGEHQQKSRKRNRFSRAPSNEHDAGGSTGACAGKTITGNEIRYKSKAGFRGTDSVSYNVTSGNRPQQLHVITINVK
jgi:hypothetical protein